MNANTEGRAPGGGGSPAGRPAAATRSWAARERGLNAVWSLALRLRDFAKRNGFLGPLDAVSAALAERLIPPRAHETRVSLPNGLIMQVPAGFHCARNYAAGLYEPDVTSLFRRILRPGMTVVDAGANIGYYTLLAAPAVGPQGRVYAFEPDPRNCAYLRHNVGLNGLGNVLIVEKAVSGYTGAGALLLAPYAARSWLGDGVAGKEERAAVQVSRLDDFFEGEGVAVDLVKMDIEGAEAAALEGMQCLAHANPRLRLIIEVNERNLRRAGVSRAALARTLAGLGFRRGYLIQRGLRSFLLPGGFPTGPENYDVLLEIAPADAESP